MKRNLFALIVLATLTASSDWGIAAPSAIARILGEHRTPIADGCSNL